MKKQISFKTSTRTFAVVLMLLLDVFVFITYDNLLLSFVMAISTVVVLFMFVRKFVNEIFLMGALTTAFGSYHFYLENILKLPSLSDNILVFVGVFGIVRSFFVLFKILKVPVLTNFINRIRKD